MTTYATVLSKKLRIELRETQDSKHTASSSSSSKAFEEVTASILFVKRGKSANELEKAFNFVLLVKGDKKLSNDKSRVLWNQVAQRGNEWLQLLDEEGKTKFYVDESDHILSIAKNNFVSLRTDWPVSQITLDKLTPEEFNASCLVLIVEENLCRQTTNFFFSLDKKKNNKLYFSTGSSIPHHAILRNSDDDKKLKMEVTLYPNNDCPIPQSEYTKSGLGNDPCVPKNIGSYFKNDKHMTLKVAATKNVLDLNVNQAASNILETSVRFDTPREFDTDNEDKNYHKGHLLKCLETGTKDLMRPVHELKLLTNAFGQGLSEGTYMRKFLHETLRFACACLNERTNGTIHFGVADQVRNQAQGYQSREIVGVPVSIEAFSSFDEKLTEYIEKCFDEYSIARTCIRPPSFIPVGTIQAEHTYSDELYVIEVDVVPSYSLCRNECFCVKLPLLEDVNRLDNYEKYFVRDGAFSRPLDNNELRDFIAKKRPKVDEERKRREEELSKTAPTNEDSRHLFRKLQRLLCAGKKTLDSSHYPILIVGKPDETMTRSYLASNFQFVTNVNWQAIIDFDNQGSKSHNLCKIFTEKGRNCDIHEAEDFDGDEQLINGILGNTFWIFGNGYDNLRKPLVDFKQWRNSKRKRGITQIIHFLSKTLPQTRTTVLFLILSKACEEMADTFAEFCTYFDGPNQLLYIVEDKQIASSWKAELCQTCLTKSEVVERGVVGMSWNELQQCIDQMVHGTDPEEIYLMMSSGSQYPLKANHFNSLTVLNTRKCEEIENYEHEKFQALCNSEESQFYNGSPVSWENFWFTDKGYNHVLKRDDYKDLLEKVCKALKHDLTNERVKTVTLYHHNGAGASTMGRQILWDLRNNETYPCRCTVVSRIDDNTAGELIQLRSIGYRSKDPSCPPVLAFVENIDDFVFKEFKFRVAEKASSLPKSEKPVCVFLYCKSVQNPIKCSSTELETSGHLEQKLTENEKKWFERKYKEMEKKFNSSARISMFEKYASENLISFMIMKENFNPSYARNLVKRNLENVSGSEYKLLTYMSLLNVFDPYPVFAASFDTIMLSPGFIRKKMFRDWIYDLSSSASVFLREKDCSEQFGTGKAIVIVHPIIASELLDQIASAEGKSVGDITLEFLCCGLFEHHSSYNYTTNHLRSATNIMLKHRKKFDYGDEKQTKFSPLIEKILYPSGAPTMETIEKAVTVLEAGLEKFSDPMLAQQIARVYYLNAERFGEVEVETYFQKAIKFAQKAINMSPKNSYLLDTMGRIFEKKLKVKYNPVSIILLEEDEAVPVLELACETSQWFQKSQTASIDNPYEENKCGYMGELSNMFTLLDIIRSVRLFREKNGAETLKKYLTVMDFIPLPISKLWDNYHVFMKRLEKRYLECMEELAEDYSVFKEDLMLSTNMLERKRIAWFKVQYCSYFGRTIELDSENTLPEDRILYRRQEINKCLAGDFFYGVFNIANMPRKGNTVVDKPREILQRLKKLIEENLAEPHCTCDHRDLLGMITTSMALHSPYGNPDRSSLQRRSTAAVSDEYKDTYKLIERLCAMESTRSRGRLYSYLLKVMFLWPRENIELGPNYIPQDFYDAMKKLSVEYASKKKSKADTEKSIKQDMYKAMTFRNKNRQYTNLFYLGTGNGMDVFVHLNELPIASTGRGGSSVDWDQPRVRTRLKRLTGTIESRNIIKMRNPQDPERTVDIYYTGSHHGNFSKEEVSFYLGFSWSRPIALDLRYNKDVRREPVVMFSFSPIHGVLPDLKGTKFTVMPFEQYLNETRKLKRKLDEILQLRKKKDKGTTLEANQVMI